MGDQMMETTMPGKPTFELLAALEEQIARYNRIIGMAEALLEPIILRVGDKVTQDRPHEMPQHSLHEAVLKFSDANDRFEDLRSRIRL